MAVVETVTREVRILCGKEYQVTITRRKGLDRYIDHGKEILADEATFCDYGPKMGTARNYTLHKAVQPTEAEREAGRRHVQDVAARVMSEQGLW